MSNPPQKTYRTTESIAIRGRMVSARQLVKLAPEAAQKLNGLYKRSVLEEVKDDKPAAT
jgi:hypothetical protein